MSEKLGFAIIGCGVVGHKHAQEISGMLDAHLVAVADIIPQRAQEVANSYNALWFVDYHQMLELPNVDIVTVCVPSGMHAQVAVDAAQAGKHLIVEKPIDLSLQKADWLIEEANRAHVLLSVVSQHRFDESTVRVKQAVNKGKLGNLFLAQASVFWYRSQGYYDSEDWRGTWALDGGALMNQSIHTIDLLQYMMGSVDEVYALTGTYAHKMEAEDTAVVTVKFQGGVLATIAATTGAYPGLSARLEIFGDLGSAVIDGDRLTYLYEADHTIEGIERRVIAENLANSMTKNNAETSVAPLWSESSAHRLQFQDMINAVQTGAQPFVRGEDGRKVLETILAIYESSRTGKPMRLH